MNEAPRYRVNMNFAPLVWNVESWQVVNFRNRNYLNSLWMGTVVNLLNLPTRLYYEVFVIGCKTNILIAMFMLFQVAISTLSRTMSGLCGQLHALKAPIEVIARMRDSTDAELAADSVTGLMFPVQEL